MHDAATGKILFQTRLPTSVQGFPITYAVNGRQYLAVPVGTGGGQWVTTIPAELTPEKKISAGRQRDVRVRAARDAPLARASVVSAFRQTSVNAGPAVVRGTVYWGSGYVRSGIEGSGNNQLFAFSIDGK